MDAFVGADRHRPGDMGERAVFSGRQRLLDERDPGCGTGGEIGFEFGSAPGLVGVDDKRGLGSGVADRGEALGSPRRQASP